MKQDQAKNISKEDKLRALGKAFWNIATLYGFTQNEQALILGIKANRTRLSKLKDENSIPDDVDKMERVANLVSIHKNLRILFPNNREVVYAWMKTKRDLFDGFSALEYIGQNEEYSMRRIFTVRRLLDQIRVSA